MQRNKMVRVTICNDIHILILYSLKGLHVKLHTLLKMSSKWKSVRIIWSYIHLLATFSSQNVYHLHFICGHVYHFMFHRSFVLGSTHYSHVSYLFIFLISPVEKCTSVSIITITTILSWRNIIIIYLSHIFPNYLRRVICRMSNSLNTYPAATRGVSSSFSTCKFTRIYCGIYESVRWMAIFGSQTWVHGKPFLYHAFSLGWPKF
jgi:hypothetical protein